MAKKRKKSKKKDFSHVEESLSTWRTAMANIKNFDKEELEVMLQLEIAGKNRSSVKSRIHSRLARLKSAEERKQLMEI